MIQQINMIIQSISRIYVVYKKTYKEKDGFKQSDEIKSRIFHNKVLPKVYDSKVNEINVRLMKLDATELYLVCNSPLWKP